jgi:WD40 repeat protein
MILVQREYEASNFHRVRELLDQQVPRTPGIPDLRGFEWNYWYHLTHQGRFTLESPNGFYAVVFSPDGARLTSANLYTSFQIWGGGTGQLIRTIESRRSGGNLMSSDGARIASVSRQNVVKVWDGGTGQLIRTIDLQSSGVISLSPDGKHLASTSQDGGFKVWAIDSGRELLTFKGHPRPATIPPAFPWGVSNIVFSPDGRRLVSVEVDATATLWDTGTGRELFTLEGVGQAVAFSPDSKRLATYGRSIIRLWDTNNGRELLTLEGKGWGIGSPGLAFSPDGKRLASIGSDANSVKTVKVWDAGTGKVLLSLNGPDFPNQRLARGLSFRPTTIAFSPDGTCLASGYEGHVEETGGPIKVWNSFTGSELLSLTGHEGGVVSMAFSGDGMRLASIGRDRTIKVWSIAPGLQFSAPARFIKTGESRNPFTGKMQSSGDYNAITCLAFSPNGRRIAFGSLDQTVTVCDAVNGGKLLDFAGHISGVTSIVFSPDGTRIASASGAKDSSKGDVKVWESATGRELLSLRGHTSGVHAVAFSPDGKRLASAGHDRTIRLWDAETGNELFVLEGHHGPVYRVAFSPNGTRLASLEGSGQIKVWDSANGSEILSLKNPKGTDWSIAWSPEGLWLASCGRSGTVTIWDVVNGKEIRTLIGHGWLKSVAFNHDGRRLASGGEDGTIKLWDSATGYEVLNLIGNGPEAVEYVAFSPDGQRLAGVFGLWTVRIFETASDAEAMTRRRELIRRATTLINAGLFPEEIASLLEKHLSLNESDRRLVLQTAQRRYNLSPELLNSAAWNRVKTAGHRPEEFALALDAAEAAVRLGPADGMFLNTLGVAQYRTGRYAEALATLTESEKLNTPKIGSQPADLAFMAMAQHQLGQKDNAKATLSRLQGLMKEEAWAKNLEAQAFLRETESLIEGKGQD